MNQEQNILRRPTFKFAPIPVEIALTSELSAKAKGILLYLLTRPDNWHFYQAEIYSHFADGKDSIRTGLEELKDKGYLAITRTRNKKGEFIGWNYEILLDENGNRITENPKYGNPDFGKSATNNIDNIVKTERNNKEEKIYNKKEESAEAIYAEYPRKLSKKEAIKAILKAMTKYEPEFLLERTKLYAKATAWKDKTYIPYPSTWFNQERFNDNEAEWQTTPNGKFQLSEGGLSTLQAIKRSSGTPNGQEDEFPI